MGALRRIAQKLIWRLYGVRHARAKPHGWPNAPAGLRPGINEGRASFQATVPEPLVTWPLDLDIGEVAPGYHLIARSVSLFAKDLLLEYAFAPELTGEAHREVWLNMRFGADVSPSSWDYLGAEEDVQYERPPLDARYAWFDFFPPDYEWMDDSDRRGQPDSDYQRNRVSRLTLDLRTGQAQIEK
jgi:hypothetical protein